MIVIDPTDPTAGKLRDTHFCRWADGQMCGCLRWGALMVSVVHETRPPPRIFSIPLQVGRDEEGAPTGGGPPLAAQCGDDDGLIYTMAGFAETIVAGISFAPPHYQNHYRIVDHDLPLTFVSCE